MTKTRFEYTFEVELVLCLLLAVVVCLMGSFNIGGKYNLHLTASVYYEDFNHRVIVELSSRTPRAKLYNTMFIQERQLEWQRYEITSPPI